MMMHFCLSADCMAVANNNKNRAKTEMRFMSVRLLR